MPKQAAFLKNIRDRIDNYFRIVLRNCRDTVPKQVGYFLVQRSQDKLNKDLWMRINANQRISNMLGEPPSVTERRKNLKNTIDTMRQSLKVLQRDPEITAAGGDDSEIAEELKRQQMEVTAREKGAAQPRGPPMQGGSGGPPQQRQGPPPQGNPNMNNGRGPPMQGGPPQQRQGPPQGAPGQGPPGQGPPQQRQGPPPGTPNQGPPQGRGGPPGRGPPPSNNLFGDPLAGGRAGN
jgi:hypothetical protein